MKRNISVLWIYPTVFLLVLCIIACQRGVPDTPNVLSPAVMVDDVMYVLLGEELDTAPLESSYSGKITSVVKLTEFPAQNGEANFDCLNAPYVILDEGVAVRFNEKWMLFEKLDD